MSHTVSTPTYIRIQRCRLEDDGVPTEALRLIATSGFLSIKELGKFLLLTSKAMTSSMYTEKEVWHLLLQSRFSFSPETISKLPMHAREMFLALFLRGEKKRRPIAIRDLEHQPSDYKVMINVFEGLGGRAICSRMIDGGDIRSFFDDGSLTIGNLQLPFCYYEDLSVTVQILRLRDQKVLRLYQEQEPICSEVSYIFFGLQRHLELRDYDYGQRLFEVISDDLDQQMLGISVDVDAECHSCPCCCVAPHEIHTLTVSAKLDYPEDVEDFPSGRNVTFAHFLEEFYGWE